MAIIMTAADREAAHFLLLQLNDATFPIGSYSLSWGLETFVQQGIVRDTISAHQYIKAELESSFLYSELLPVRFAWEYAGDIGKTAKLDDIYEASRTPIELREGSRKLASRFIKTTGAWEEQNKSNGPDGKADYTIRYYPVAYGVYCALHGVGEKDTLSAFLYNQTSARVTTSVKLVPLSQTSGQTLLHSLIMSFPQLVERTMELEYNDLCRSCPGIDIRAMQHETLYTRLYMS
jgi:urease accessory protein